MLLVAGAISCSSEKQNCFALPTCRADYISICLASKQSICLSHLLAEILDKKEPKLIVIGVDNNRKIDGAKNASIKRRNTGIDLQYPFVRNSCHSNLLELRQVTSKSHIAYSLTNPIDPQNFCKLRECQGLRSKSAF